MGPIHLKLIGNKRLVGACDLTFGRVLALRARLALLKTELAQKKSTPGSFEKEENNTWSILPSATPPPPTPANDTIKLATQLLEQVVAEHSGTPFAFVAAEELKRGFGWKWQESRKVYRNPPPENLFRPLLIREVNPQGGGDFFGGAGKGRIVRRQRPGL